MAPELPEPDMFGQFPGIMPLPGPGVEGVVAGVVAAATWAAGTPPDALAAAAVVRETTPMPSPVSPAAVAPTRSIRFAVRFIKQLLIGGTPPVGDRSGGLAADPVNRSQLGEP
ncbi:MAG TPA: hypothetical protein VNH82_09885 [Candidatus Dormibacteraeota bacterium]|nr:hypothetical protein [Candidatus Dormibacteraeota bacterium]HVC23718.1 hypothetical protein [Candidatus Dormibacteraeota bacterium]